MKPTARLLVLGLVTAFLLPGAAFAADGELPPAALIGMLAAGVILCAGLVAYQRALGLLLTAQYGAGLAVYLAHQHRVGLTGGTSICNISSVINCDAVNASRYSEVAGVPIALFGLAFYFVACVLAFKLLKSQSRTAAAMLMSLSVLAVGYDIYPAWASYSLGAICLFCAASWAVNLLLLVGSTLEAKGTSPVVAIQAEGSGAVIAGLAALIVGVLVYQAGAPSTGGTGPKAPPEPAALASLYELPMGTITLDGTEPMKGDPNAPYTFVEWADFQCPHCAVMFPVMEEILAENKDVKLYYKHYPISGNCNRFVEGARHENACQAAAAAECARGQGRFWELAGQMFKNQEYLGKDDIRFMVEQVGLEPKAFEACMADPATAQSIAADVEAGGTAQISGTPSIFLKGPFGDQWVRVVGGKDAIETILTAARGGKPMPAPPPANPER